MAAPSMTICDLSPLYCAKGGGIRTFHHARMDWFGRQTLHRYILIAPGPRFSIARPSPNVWLVHAYGVPTSRDADRYRILVNYAPVRAFVEQMRPDVLEAHDPFFSMPFAWWLRRQGAHRALLTSFCHTDPVGTYVAPHAPRAVTEWARRGFSIMQRQFHGTFVASDAMRLRLTTAGVNNVMTVGLGLDPKLLGMRRRAGPLRRTRLLYAGRLDADKEFGLLMDALPRILKYAGMRVTIVGAGQYQKRLRALQHPRLRYLGFFADRATMRAVYAAHDVLLAPGRFETFGLAALEAAAAGLAVVGPDLGGTGDLLREMHSPLMFRAGDTQMFLDRIEAAVDDDTSLLVERGRAVAARYGGWDDAVARHVAACESMMGDDARTEALDRPA
jgi:alpha-1,6-mannosyltransferase